MPNFRASYEAEAMMPPLLTADGHGFAPQPRVGGLLHGREEGVGVEMDDGAMAASSNDRDQWMRVRAIDQQSRSYSDFIPLRSADQRLEHALNHQLLRGDEIGILRVLGFQIRLAALQDEGLERAFAVNERGHDLPLRGSGPCSNTTMSPSQNVPADHRIARHAQRERVPRRLEADALDVHRHATLGFLLARPAANPAGIEPNSGMSTMRLRSFASGEMTRNDRALPGSESMNPFRFSASR